MVGNIKLQKKTASLLKLCQGKTLIIDEAYTLNEKPYGHNALDTLVGTIHGATGEDIYCILKKCRRCFERQMTVLKGDLI